VVLEVKIDAAGHVSDARVLSGPEELRRAALQAILQWHYSPKAMSLPATTQETLEFKLPKGGSPATARIAPVLAAFTLKGIEVEGLPAAVRDDLLQRLPVRVGDTVDAKIMQSVTEAVHAFDDHLLVSAASKEGTLRVVLAAPARIRVGGHVQQMKLRAKVQPVYPPEAKAQGLQGIVKLRATLDKDGNVAKLEVISGDPILAAASLEAVRQWQYETTLLNGEPVEVVTDIDVNFTLAR
jgi:TonB family protein